MTELPGKGAVAIEEDRNKDFKDLGVAGEVWLAGLEWRSGTRIGIWVRFSPETFKIIWNNDNQVASTSLSLSQVLSFSPSVLGRP